MGTLEHIRTVGLAALALGLCAGSVSGQAPRPLFDVLSACEAWAQGDALVFAGAELRIDPTDATISYAEINTDFGEATVKLFDDAPVCWTYGALFTDEGRRTSIPHAAVYEPITQHFTQRATDPITLQIVEGIGGSVQFCDGDTVTLRLSFSSAGTDDPERSWAFQANATPHTSRYCP